MQIVIDIPTYVYNGVKSQGLQPSDVAYRAIISDSIKEGVPLPKGHGALKDVDNIKTAFPSGEYVRTESVKATIDHEETIIEADRSGEV